MVNQISSTDQQGLRLAAPAAALTGDATNGCALFGVECADCHGPEGENPLIKMPSFGDGCTAVLIAYVMQLNFRR